MKVVALTFGGPDCASSQYRVFQYQIPLRDSGIMLDAFPAREVNDRVIPPNSVLLIQKRLFRLSILQRLRKLAVKLIYDIDDAIWQPHSHPHHLFTRWRALLRLRQTCRLADLVIVSNPHLAKALESWSKKIAVLPMALNEAQWLAPSLPPSQPATLGWAGAPSNLPFLLELEPALAKLQRKHRSLPMLVYSGQKPRWNGLIRFKFLPYSPGNEATAVRHFSIGLLPLPDTPFAAAKSPIKALQYLASGIPTVATPLPGAVSILTDQKTALFARNTEEWLQQIDFLLTNPARREEMGREAQADFLSRFSLSQVLPKFAELLKSA